MSLLRISQQILITPLYFKYPLFKIDKEYFFNYWNKNPYRLCKQFFCKEGVKEVFYGDSWPFSIPHFVKYTPISKEDVLFDIGSGIGRISFWFQIISQCTVVAIEKVPFFIQTAEKIKQKLNLSKIEFLEQDLLNIDYERASIIYFYGSSFEDDFILKLIEKWKSLKAGVRVITTSFSLSEYGALNFRILKRFYVSYPWGTCEVFIQVKE